MGYVDASRSNLGPYGISFRSAARVATVMNDLRRTSSQYASSCYETEIPPEECTSFSPRLPSWTKSLRAGCPFGDNLCDGNQYLHIDSGYIDSTLDLGINSPVEDRLSLHLVKECAPLVRDGYMTTYDGKNISDLFVVQDPASIFGAGWESVSYEVLHYGQTQKTPYKQQNTTFVLTSNAFNPGIYGSPGFTFTTPSDMIL